jgi:uncharacterized protein (TIGR02246 family)
VLFRLSLATVLMAALLFPFSARCQQPLTTMPQQQLDIVKVLLAQEEAWNRGDLNAFSQTYKDSPDILFVTTTVNKGFAGMLEEYRRDYPNKAAMGTLAFSDLEVRPLDEHFAVVVGRYNLERGKKEGGNATGLFSLVLEKTDKGWKIIVDHTTS